MCMERTRRRGNGGRSAPARLIRWTCLPRKVENISSLVEKISFAGIAHPMGIYLPPRERAEEA